MTHYKMEDWKLDLMPKGEKKDKTQEKVKC